MENIMEPHLFRGCFAFELDVHSIKRFHETWTGHKALTIMKEWE